MNRLHTELHRLYLLPGPVEQGASFDEARLMGPDGRVRALVLELARPADWGSIAKVWQGVQSDLALPAPAIAVSGIDGYQLWFSLCEPVGVAQARAFLEWLRLRYLSGIAPGRVAMLPTIDTEAPGQARHAALVPARQDATGCWSAFVASDLAAMFAGDPWLDLPPTPDAQANLLSRLESIRSADFQRALERLKPVAAPATQALVDAPGGATDAAGAGWAPAGHRQDPKGFLLEVMNDGAMALHLRIEAAKALLPYFEGTPRR